GIANALDAGADIVVCGRVTDAALVVGPAAAWHGWARDDWDRLAGAVVAGHVLECGAQATGGNYCFLDELPDARYPGFPIAEHAFGMLFDVLGGREQFASVDVQLIRSDQADAPTNAQALAQLRITVKDPDPTKVGRRFANAVIELALASYAGFFTTSAPGGETAYGVYLPTFVPADLVEHTVLLPDRGRTVVPHPAPTTA